MNESRNDVVNPLAELDRVFDLQRAAFSRQPNPPAGERVRQLDALARMLREHTDAIADAVRTDFGHRPVHETKLLELFPTLDELRHARRHVTRWMRPARRAPAIWFRPGRARVVKQPLGVVGVMVPWNYPIYLAIGPLVAALAAGNRVMIKMSELTPRTGELLARLVSSCFAPDQVAVVNGAVEVAQAFAAKPFDHLLFTGSTAVGRHVMRAAAANLTPVTLELGGKSPALVAPGFPPDVAAQRILFGKCLNAGQTCIAPDYVLLPETALADFIDAARDEVRRLYPDGAASPDYCAIVNEHHYARLRGLLDGARAAGAQVVSLMPDAPASGRKLAPALLTGVTDAMPVMQEEIFGPLLPVVTYRALDEALDYIARRPRPLAFYYFDLDRARIERVLQQSIAGGVTVNDTILHIAQPELPFGGVGASGMGQYHGEEGFKTFSKYKGVFYQSRVSATFLLKPPYGKRVARLLRLLLR